MTQEATVAAPDLIRRRASGWARFGALMLADKKALVGLVLLSIFVFAAVFGPLISPYDPNDMAYDMIMGPSLAHPLGTDDLGRDLFARTVQGTQVSLMVGIVGAFVAVGLGTLYGATAGYLGGRVDNIMMRIVDVLLSIPYMFVLILLLVMFGRSLFMLFVGIGLISWLDMARIVRSQALTLKNR